jgi:succinoglycan biosynthesis transport protein ExoP
MSAQESTQAPDVPQAAPPALRAIVGPTAGPPPILTGPPTVARLLRALHRRWLPALALALLGGGLMGAGLWKLVPVRFTAETWLEVRPEGRGADPAAAARFQKTQAQVLKSPGVLTAALHRPDVAAVAAPSRHRGLPQAAAGGRDPLAWLDGMLTVDADRPGVLRVQAVGVDSEEIALVLRAVIRTYLQEQADQRQAALDQLREVYARGDKELREKKERLAGLDNPRLPAAEKDLQQARFDLQKAQVELNLQLAQEKRVAEMPAPEEAVLAALKEDPTGRDLLADLARVENQIQTILRISVLGDKDPHLKDFLKEREAVRKKLDRRRSAVQPAVEQQVRARARADLDGVLGRLRARVASLGEMKNNLEAEVRRLAPDASQVRTLREEIASRQEAQNKLGAEVQAAQIEQAAGGVSWRGESEMRTSEDGRERLRAAVSGSAGIGLLLALAVAWREVRKGVVYRAGEVAGGLGIPLVGSVPAVPARVLTADRPPRARDAGRQGRLTEAVDALRTLLLRGAAGRPQVALITSAVGGEGKTTLAGQLASSLARAWRKTVLIDGDMRKPAAHLRFGLPLEPGLSEVLRGEVEIADALQPTSEGRLWVLPAGHWDAHAVGALAQDAPARLFGLLKEQYDFIVLDAPPVLPVADALLLSQHADAVLLAILGGTSRLSAVHAARQRLAALDVPLLGAVAIGLEGDLGVVDVHYPAS